MLLWSSPTALWSSNLPSTACRSLIPISNLKIPWRTSQAAVHKTICIYGHVHCNCHWSKKKFGMTAAIKRGKASSFENSDIHPSFSCLQLLYFMVEEMLHFHSFSWSSMMAREDGVRRRPLACSLWLLRWLEWQLPPQIEPHTRRALMSKRLTDEGFSLLTLTSARARRSCQEMR